MSQSICSLPCGLDSLCAGTALNCYCEVGKCDSGVGDDLTGDSGHLFWAINQAFVLVDNVDDGGELAGVGSVGDEDNAAYFDVT